MTDLTACYFCGTASDALSAYEVPPVPVPATERASVTLCPDCHDKLGRVFERVAVPDGERAAGPGAGDAREAASESGPSHTGTHGGSHPSRTGQSEGSTADTGITFGTGDSDGGENAPAPGAGASETADAVGEGAAGDDRADATADAADPDSDADEMTSGADDANESAAPGSAADGSAADGSVPAAGPSPENYRRVLRLLENREFPVDRAEIRGVVETAYGVEPDEFERVVEAAAAREVLAVDGDRLRRPE